MRLSIDHDLSGMDRRSFLITTTTALTMAPAAWSMGEGGRLGIAILDHGPGARARPRSIEQLMWEVSKRTSIHVRERPEFVSPASPALFNHPLIIWIGTGDCAPFSQKERDHLRRYLRSGGTLFVDDASSPGDDAFDTCVRREMAALWPEQPWTTFDNDHTIFRSFYLLQQPEGRIKRQAFLEGIYFDDRSPVIYSRNDMLGALGRAELGGWSLPVTPGGPPQRERAFRLGINLVLYATCLNYKRDQVHVTAILRRRRWRIETPKPAP